MSLEFMTISPGNQKPNYLLVALHGWGANAEDLSFLASVLNLPDYQFLFPNAPFPHPQVPGGRAWYSLETPQYEGLAESRSLLENWLISLEASTSVPLNKTILVGFSQGGAMTLDVGLRLPLGALCSLSGYLHSQPALEYTSTPVLIIHGRQDQVVPITAAERARNELLRLGVPVEYHEFNMGHEIQPAVLGILQEFIRAKI